METGTGIGIEVVFDGEMWTFYFRILELGEIQLKFLIERVEILKIELRSKQWSFLGLGSDLSSNGSDVQFGGVRSCAN